jgi:hypothetical protein
MRRRRVANDQIIAMIGTARGAAISELCVRLVFDGDDFGVSHFDSIFDDF